MAHLSAGRNISGRKSQGRRELPLSATAWHPESNAPGELFPARSVNFNAEQFFLFFVNHDSRRHHQHQTFRFTADT